MLTRVFLIRHGITDWNKEKRYCGSKDVSLSSQGRKQAEKLRRKLKSFTFDRVYSSGKKRALETAKIIFKGAKISRTKGLRELNFGILEGLTHDEIMHRYGNTYKKWLKDPFRNHIPKAERMRAFKKRVNNCIKKIVRLHPGKKIALVCHGGTIAVHLHSILKKGKFRRYIPKAGTITVVKYNKNRWVR